MKQLINLKRKKRILLAFGGICVLFVLLVGKLVFVQGIFSSAYEEKQSAMLMQRLPLTASRGDIYDRNMALLAKDATCASIYVSPNSIKKQEDKAAVARLLSKYLHMEYEDVYRICIKDTAQSVIVKRKVDNSVALNIKEDAKQQELSGISIVEDKKRYYTNGRFAPYLLGFTGIDHKGLYGIEASYNKELAGTNGVVLYQTDGEGRIVASGSEIKQDAIDGNNLVLSVDSVIQMYAENAVADAMKRTKAKRVIAIVSNPSNGEILAMAVTPSYDLNNPWDLDAAFESKYARSFYKTENKKTVAMDDSEKLAMMWDNPVASFLYEPGSTFKPITVASALEEGTVSGKTKFYCGGSRNVGGTRIHCANHNAHGKQRTGEALENSCNVAMMEIAMRMGPDAFYKYIYNFGFGQKTEVKLQGEEKGIVPANDNLSVIDYVTKGFGQSISVTPVQMAMSLNSVINGGFLYQPKLVTQITDNNGKTLSKEEKKIVRQVISSDTSSLLRGYLRKTAEKYTSIQQYNTKSLQLGGKTGTAQKIVNGRYSNSIYVCSFYGFAPYNNPKLSCIVIVDEPKSRKSGAAAAAPVSAEILSNSLKYLNSVESSRSSKLRKAGKSITVPDVRGENLTDAKSLFDSLGIKYKIKYASGKKINDSNASVISQSYYQKKYDKKVVLEVDAQTKDMEVAVPDLSGMSVQSANEALSKQGLKIKVEGGGICVKQSIEAGKKVKKGTTVTVTFKFEK